MSDPKPILDDVLRRPPEEAEAWVFHVYLGYQLGCLLDPLVRAVIRQELARDPEYQANLRRYHAMLGDLVNDGGGDGTRP